MFCKKLLLEISQNLQENTWPESILIKLQAWNKLFLIKLQLQACKFIQKETLAQVFSCEFCEIF